jgi:hypothetical protein
MIQPNLGNLRRARCAAIRVLRKKSDGEIVRELCQLRVGYVLRLNGSCYERANVLGVITGESAFRLEAQTVRGIVYLDAQHRASLECLRQPRPSAGELPCQTIAGAMPGIGLRKLLKLQQNFEGCLGESISTMGERERFPENSRYWLLACRSTLT